MARTISVWLLFLCTLGCVDRTRLNSRCEWNREIVGALEFRDPQYQQGVNMSKLKFGTLAQLKYFQQGLAAIKGGGNGDAANFKEYTVTRNDVKKEIAYTLTSTDGALINFKQAEADKMIAAIKAL